MQHVRNDENAAVPATSIGKNAPLSTKKSHKSALGDVKNTIHNTPMGAIPKTGHSTRLMPKASPMCKSPVNHLISSVTKSGLPAASSIQKPKKKKNNIRNVFDMENLMKIDYESMSPGCSFKDDEYSVATAWGMQSLPTDEEIERLILLTMNNDCKEVPPKAYPFPEPVPIECDDDFSGFFDNEIKSPPVAPPASPDPDFSYLSPPRSADRLEEDFASFHF